MLSELLSLPRDFTFAERLHPNRTKAKVTKREDGLYELRVVKPDRLEYACVVNELRMVYGYSIRGKKATPITKQQCLLQIIDLAKCSKWDTIRM